MEVVVYVSEAQNRKRRCWKVEVTVRLDSQPVIWTVPPKLSFERIDGDNALLANEIRREIASRIELFERPGDDRPGVIPGGDSNFTDHVKSVVIAMLPHLAARKRARVETANLFSHIHTGGNLLRSELFINGFQKVEGAVPTELVSRVKKIHQKVLRNRQDGMATHTHDGSRIRGWSDAKHMVSSFCIALHGALHVDSMTRACNSSMASGSIPGLARVPTKSSATWKG